MLLKGLFSIDLRYYEILSLGYAWSPNDEVPLTPEFWLALPSWSATCPVTQPIVGIGDLCMIR